MIEDVQSQFHIRNARPEDAGSVIPLVLLAIGDIGQLLTAAQSHDEACEILSEFFRSEGNRFSYRNALVLDFGGRAAGVAIYYGGSDAGALDEPLVRAARTKTGAAKYQIPVEAEVDEFYIDTLCVHPAFRGLGCGGQLVEAICRLARFRGYTRVGLLVERENPDARRLYERLNFFASGTKQIGGHQFDHMVRIVD